MAKHIIALLLLLYPLLSAAQQCAYDDYYLFAVNVHAKNNGDKIPGLKMYLTDESGNPITAESLIKENKEWINRRDTLFFWDNASISKNEGTAPLVKRKFFHIGDCYVVVFRMDMRKLKDPIKRPLFRLKIVSGENEWTGNPYPDQDYHLPLNKSIPLCNNGILENFKLVNPVKSLDGQEFKLIDITLNEFSIPNLAEDVFDKYPKYILRPDYEISINPAAYNRKEFMLKAVTVHNATIGTIHQYIEIPGKAIGFSETKDRLLETGDYYQRSIKEALDFSVIMEEWRDTVFNVSRKKTHFYIFNRETEKYEPDSILNKETDVYYYSGLKTMRRLEYLVTEKSKIINTYQLENRQWKLIDKREELLPAFKPKVKYAPSACVVFGEKYHRLPVCAAIGTNAKLIIKDSFLLFNYCEDTINIINIKSQNRDFFSIPQTLPPRQYTKLSFEGIITNSSWDFITKSFACYLTLEDNTTLSFAIDIPTISNNSKIYYKNDGTIDYAVAQKNDSKYTHAILMDSDGNIRAMGMVQNGDTSIKEGKWQYFEKGDWKINEIIYSKEISLSALNQKLNYGNAEFNIKVLENGVWKEKDRGPGTIYITEATDSIVAFNDSLAFGFSLPYRQIPDNIQIRFYLLKPGERTLKIGYQQTPFQVIKDQYTIIPDYSKVKDRNRTTYQITDSIVKSLLKQYPKIIEVYISKNKRGISLESMKEDEKEFLLSQLAKDEGISFVCQVFSYTDKEAISYCDNRIYVELDGNKSDSLKRVAMRLGFSEMQADIGSNRYWLIFDSKIIDESFFRAYKKLTETPWILSAYMNSYHEAELDNKVRPAEIKD